MFCLLAGGLAVVSGCRTAPAVAPDVTTTDEIVLEAPYAEAWEATRDTLRALEYTLYTRDKRGLFVAYSKERRHRILIPRRTQFSLVLEPVTPTQTRVTVETLPQRYWVTLLTYPDWRESPEPADPEEGRAILRDIRMRLEKTAKSSGD